MRLVHISYLYRIAPTNGAAIGLFETHQQFKERGHPTGSVRTDDTDHSEGAGEKLRFSNNTRPRRTWSRSQTHCTPHFPGAGPGMKSSSLSSRSLHPSFGKRSYARYTGLWILRDDLSMRAHSNSRSSVLRRLLSVFSSRSQTIRFLFDRRSNFPSTEYLHHDPVRGSSPLRLSRK